VLDAVAAVAEGPAAITLCRGGASKTYQHVDPNEDATCFAFGEYGILVAVADGHHGARGAERAVWWLIENCGVAWTSTAELGTKQTLQHDAQTALREIHREVIAEAAALRVAPAPTTVSFALVRPGENLLLHASVGDSHVFLATATDDETHSARDLAWATTGRARCSFLGERYEGGSLDASQWVIGCEPLTGARAVLLATDGLSEIRIGVEDPAAAAAQAVEHALRFDPSLRPLEASRHLCETALAAQRRNAAGDNVSTAVIWIPERG
jgi:serine/threonine protein phosphatase PrpC